MQATVPPHWLRRNEGSRSPHRVLILDTETRPQGRMPAEEHRLRWWHARHHRRHVDRPRGPVFADYAGTTADELAAVVDKIAIAKHSLWIYTHNLGFDMQITRLPEGLYNLGWKIVDIGITGRSPWIRMGCGRRRIVFADSGSWLPAPLADVGPLVGVDKPVVEDWHNATDEEIAVRCLADVVILSGAMITIMDWWDEYDMGRWQWTGPGCGWAAFRHKFLTAKVLMDPDPVRLSLERQAIYGGRREAYRVGDLGPGRYADLDFEAAYPQIASYLPLPRRPIARVPYMTAEAYAKLPTDWGVLSECVVTTSRPVVPCRVDGHVLYPVGTFKTVLAGPDIAGAIEYGATVKLGDTIIYQLEPFLSEWGKWITRVINGSEQGVPAVVRMWGKHVSRTVIGRFAMRKQRTEDWGEACWPDWHAEPGTDLDTGCEVIDLHACGRHLRVYRDAEPENVFPAVTAWIEAECRQALARAMDACPPGSVVQCDTDGFMLDLSGEWGTASAAGSASVSAVGTGTPAAELPPPVPERIGRLRIRVKGLYRNAVILGPQQVTLGDSRRIAGVPRSFTPLSELTYHGWAWPGYSWQLANSKPGIYLRPHVTVSLRGPYGTRWIGANGGTVAPRLSVKRGANAIHPLHVRTAKRRTGQYAPDQPAILSKYLG